MREGHRLDPANLHRPSSAYENYPRIAAAPGQSWTSYGIVAAAIAMTAVWLIWG